jgi:hypothetical protein
MNTSLAFKEIVKNSKCISSDYKDLKCVNCKVAGKFDHVFVFHKITILNVDVITNCRSCCSTQYYTVCVVD